MDAPKGRYRIEERGRRLVVIDTAADPAPAADPAAPADADRIGPAPAGPSLAGPSLAGSSPSGRSRPSPSSPGPRPAAAPGWVDRAGRLLLHLVVNRWEKDGGAVIGWEWETNGRTRRWDARLDAARQQRLGRALVAIAAFPLLILLFVLGLWPLWPLVLPAFLAAAWGVHMIGRLQRETGGG